MRKHPILKELFGFEIKQNEVAIVWLGQNGFLIKSKSGVFFSIPIYPILQNNGHTAGLMNMYEFTPFPFNQKKFMV